MTRPCFASFFRNSSQNVPASLCSPLRQFGEEVFERRDLSVPPRPEQMPPLDDHRAIGHRLHSRASARQQDRKA